MAFFTGKEAEIKKTSTLSPEQQYMMEGLGKYLEGKIGEGLPAWEGGFTAPLTGIEQAGQGLLSQYVTGGPGEAGQAGLGSFLSMMNVDPKQLEAEYMKYQAPAEQRYLKENLIPTFKESMVPGGTLRSTGTERGIGDIISRFGEGQLGRIGESIEAARGRAAGLIPQTGMMAGIEGGVPQIEAAMQYGQLSRMVEQAELNAQIQEFVRTTPELSPLMNRMLEYLGISTQAAFLDPAQASPFMQLAAPIMEGAGKAIGASVAGG